MQAKSLIAALFAITTATSAFAQGAAPAAGQQLTRADVTAEYIRARNAGEIATSEVDYPKTPATAASHGRVLRRPQGRPDSANGSGL